MNPVRIIGREAACNLGWNWDDVWAGLLRGEARVASFSSIRQPISGLDLQVAMIPDLDREVLDDPPGAGATFRLTRAVLRSLESGTIATKTRLFGASNHGESDALIELVRAADGRSTGRTRTHCCLRWPPILCVYMPRMACISGALSGYTRPVAPAFTPWRWLLQVLPKRRGPRKPPWWWLLMLLVLSQSPGSIVPAPSHDVDVRHLTPSPMGC
jgi:hypothetical protein